MVGVDEYNLAPIDHNGFAERQWDYKQRRDLKYFNEKPSGGLGAKDDAFGPSEGEAGVVIGVEVGEEVRDGVIAGVTESVDGETGLGDVFGLRESGGKRREGEWSWGLVKEGRLGGNEERGGIQG